MLQSAFDDKTREQKFSRVLRVQILISDSYAIPVRFFAEIGCADGLMDKIQPRGEERSGAKNEFPGGLLGFTCVDAQLVQLVLVPIVDASITEPRERVGARPGARPRPPRTPS